MNQYVPLEFVLKIDLAPKTGSADSNPFEKLNHFSIQIAKSDNFCVQNFFRDLFYKAAQKRMLPDDKGFEGRSDLGIYHHFTVAIDTNNIKRVFADVRDMGKWVT